MNDISPMRIGQTDPSSHWNFKDKLGNVVSMPIGTTFTLYIYNAGTGLTKSGAGSFTIIDLSQGKIDYLWDSTDMAVAGQYLIYVGYTLPTGKSGFTATVDVTVDDITIQQ